MARLRTLAMWAILVSLPVLCVLLLVAGYYFWGYLSYDNEFCGGFARLDDEIGWVLKPSASACVNGRDALGGEVWFESAVHTDINGFRSRTPGQETPKGGILAVGDSWTFGYGVSWEDSYPGQLQELSGMPVVTAASPAYAGSQAALLAERWAKPLAVRAIVYLGFGFWERGVCTGRERPVSILKPCFWTAPDGETVLVTPPPGYVERMARFGMLPGGMLGAGEKTLAYFLISRPLAKLQQYAVRAGLVSGLGDDFRAWGADAGAIQAALLRHLARTAREADALLLLIDPGDVQETAVQALPAELRMHVRRVPDRQWREHVTLPAQQLSPAQRAVPHDGHFGPGLNRLVADLVARELRNLGVVP